MFSKGLLRCLAYCCYGFMLGACAPALNQAHTSPCQDGSRRCAAAHAPKGMRGVYKGHRMIKAQWMNTINRESRASDIGVKAQWAPITEHRQELDHAPEWIEHLIQIWPYHTISSTSSWRHSRSIQSSRSSSVEQ